MRLTDDERGLAVALVVFFAMLIVAALLFILLDPALSGVFETTESQASDPDSVGQIGLAQTIWNNIMYVPLFLGALYLITRAVIEGRLPG